MSHTFEELAGSEVDGLFQGALFLQAGDEAAAEDLLVWTLTKAFHGFRETGGGESPDQWLEGRLVHEFLALLPNSSAAPQVHTADLNRRLQRVGSVDPGVLHKAAGQVPARARAALWLVVLRRWTYDEASAALHTNTEELKDLLRFRHTLMSAVLMPRNALNGTDGGMS
ncbi:MAG: hypothetical protein BMS9Abin29_0475 [Gemmatimonadota bacterium]|nr:MAG: hypothetical protein BMS9Abin29_0475 [Gemmatimonadota bacterium]